MASKTKTLIQFSDIEKHYGVRTVLDGASALINEKQKIGVIGRNGAGKTTLFRIITGHEKPDSGTVTFSDSLRLSYMEQQPPFDDGESVLDFLMRYTGKEDWQCGKAAGRFQLKNEMLHAPIESLAGGYRMRVKLAAMILNEPNFLLLDEPSNYLDLNTLLQLENFLQSFNGAFMLISHDREFLKRTCDATLAVEHGKAEMFPGAVEDYFEYKEEQKEQAQKHNKNVESKQKQLQTFIDKNRAKATKAKQAQSKMKQLQRLNKIEIKHSLKNVHISIPDVDVKKGFIFTTRELNIGYPQKRIASGINLEIKAGEKTAILGRNGEGKSTLMKTICERLDPLGGEMRWRTDADIGYFAQHVYDLLDENESVLSYLKRKGGAQSSDEDILKMAGSFLFKDEDLEKKAKVLSGGEAARLTLAGLLLTKKNVLLLDEPTNHLDFETVEALADALKSTKATVFFISHDRTFVNILADKIIEIKDGRAEFFRGSYEEYVYMLEKEAELDEDETGKSDGDDAEKKNTGGAQTYKRRKELQAQIRKTETEMKKAESKIEKNNKEKAKLIKEFENSVENYSPELSEKLGKLEKEIENSEERWLELAEEHKAAEESLRLIDKS